MFTKSPVKRVGRDRFVRNVLIAIGNSNDAGLAADAEILLCDDSPLVRGAAVWALSQLMAGDAFASLASRCIDAERDDEVRAEWKLAGAAIS
jgi:epoxyqueuosine reductase